MKVAIGSHGQVASVVMIGVTAALILALQPLLLGSLLEQGRISVSEVGRAATFEAGGMALALTLASIFLAPRRLRLITLLSALALVTINVGSFALSGMGFVASRAISGASAGLLLWVWAGLLARSATPARLGGIFVTVQSVLVMAISTLIARMSDVISGAALGYGILAGLFALAALLVPLVPDRYESISDGDRPGLPPLPGVLGLSVVVLFMAAINAIWVYILPLADHLGYSGQLGKTAVSFALALQIPAGLLAIVFAHRLSPIAVLIGSILLNTVAVGLAATALMPVVFIVGCAAISFLWIFSPPFQVPYLVHVDSTRRAAVLVATAQLGGSALGPAIASAATGTYGAGAVPVVSIALFILALLLAAISLIMIRMKEPLGESETGMPA